MSKVYNLILCTAESRIRQWTGFILNRIYNNQISHRLVYNILGAKQYPDAVDDNLLPQHAPIRT